MSPTRRDILATIAAVPLAAVLPAQAARAEHAEVPELSATIKHAVGMAVFRDVMNSSMLAGTTEIYVDQNKAIVWIRNAEDPERRQRLIFRQPHIVGAFHILMGTMGAVFSGGTVTEMPRIDAAMCGACGGVGWFEDADGNRPDCPSCCGNGYGEDRNIVRERQMRGRRA